MGKAAVQDVRGRPLSPCPEEKARRMLREGRAELVSRDPLTIRLPYEVDIPKPEKPQESIAGGRILLHICCAPCATYTVKRLREIGWEVKGHWFNPNIHPYSEHQKRRQALRKYAKAVDLPVMWEEDYEMPSFFRAVVGHERY